MSKRNEFLDNVEAQFFSSMGFEYPYNRPKEQWAKTIDPTKKLILGDLHEPYAHDKALRTSLIHKDAGACNVIGDLGDWYSKSRFVKKRRVDFKEELRSVFLRLEWLATHFKQVNLMIGNHDCLVPETQCLTKELGWTDYTLLRKGMNVLTLKEGVAEWQPIKEVLIYDHSGDMIIVDNPRLKLKVTPNHRIIYYKKNNSDKLFEDTADSLYNMKSNSRLSIPTSGKNPQPDFDIKDDELRIIAWILTDGSIQKRGSYIGYRIYQRKSKVHLITQILDHLGYEYSIGERERNIAYICDKKLKEAPEPECNILILSNSTTRIKQLLGDQKEYPQWLYKISKRQFDIFLESLIDGDGSRQRNNPTKTKMFYCHNKRKVALIQGLLAQNNYRTTLREYPNDNWRINIAERNQIQLRESNQQTLSKTKYSGKIWCIRVENENFMVMHENKTFFTGNSRPEKLIRNLFAGETDLYILTEQDLLGRMASYFDNINMVGTKLVSHNGDTLPLSHIWQDGDVIYTHAELSRKQSTSIMESISNYLFQWKRHLNLKPYSVIIQAHNHRAMKLPRDGELWILNPCMMYPNSIGAEYIYDTRMVGSPPIIGYTLLYQEKGITDKNRTNFFIYEEL